MSNDNAFSESLFATLKHVPSYPRTPFKDIDHARSWVHQFVTHYNHEHRHRSIRHVTPHDRHEGNDAAILAARKKVIQAAKEANPGRWSGSIRNCDPVKEAILNPTERATEKPAA